MIINTWTNNRGRSAQHLRGGSDIMLKSNGPNSISKDALRDEDHPWLINCTTQEYLVNVGQDSHFNTYYFVTSKCKDSILFVKFWTIFLFNIAAFKLRYVLIKLIQNKLKLR